MSQQPSFITLEQLSLALNKHINDKFGHTYYWIVAEISGYNVRKGNCYLSLIDKDPESVYPKAEFRGLIWRSSFEEIHHKFKRETQQELKENMKILFKARLVYDNKFGIALHINDIEPGYTLGQMERDRQMVIKKLKQEGIYGLNKSKNFPAVPQRLAVISNTDSKGFEDFQDKIDNNPWGYKIKYDLYPSLLQGEKAAKDIRSKLIAIYHHMEKTGHNYDVVLILRGGGGNTNLNCFNNYDLAKAVARFPIPIVTGIGHTTNISVVDEIANTKKNTPTDVADYLIRHIREYDISISKSMQSIVAISKRIVPLESEQLDSLKKSISHQAKQAILREKNLINEQKTAIINQSKQLLLSQKETQKWALKQIVQHSLNIVKYQHSELNNISTGIKRLVPHLLEKERTSLQSAEEKIRILDPVQTLRRGFSITMVNGKPLTNAKDVKKGDLITTELANGIIESEVKQKRK